MRRVDDKLLLMSESISDELRAEVRLDLSSDSPSLYLDDLEYDDLEYDIFSAYLALRASDPRQSSTFDKAHSTPTKPACSRAAAPVLSCALATGTATRLRLSRDGALRLRLCLLPRRFEPDLEQPGRSRDPREGSERRRAKQRRPSALPTSGYFPTA